MTSFVVHWIDGDREPQNPPDPKYPNGIDLDVRTDPNAKSCTVPLRYPAKRCGAYQIECKTCGLIVLVTTAGRPDDPRSVTLGCKTRVRVH